METLITTIVFVTLLAVALYTIMSFIHERNKNKREWDAYWSNQGTFGHCGQNIKCRCKIGG